MIIQRNLFKSCILSNFADGVLFASIPLLAVKLTESPTEIATVAALRKLPWFLISLPAGVLIDQIDRFKILRNANFIRCFSLLILFTLILKGNLSIYLLMFFSFFLGFFEVFFDSTIPAVIQNIADKDKRTEMNLKFMTWERISNNFLGVAIGGLLFGISQLLPVLLSTGLYFFSFCFLFGFKSIKKEPKTEENFLKQIKIGIDFVLGNSSLKTILVLSIIGNFCSAAIDGILVLFLVTELDTPETFVGLIMTMPAIGAILGRVFAKKFQQKFGSFAIHLALFILSFSIILRPLYNEFVVALTLISAGAVSLFWGTTMVTYRQKITPSQLQGRSTTVLRFASFGILPLGYICGGLVVELTSLSSTFVIFGFLIGTKIPIAFKYLNFDDKKF